MCLQAWESHKSDSKRGLIYKSATAQKERNGLIIYSLGKRVKNSIDNYDKRYIMSVSTFFTMLGLSIVLVVVVLASEIITDEDN